MISLDRGLVLRVTGSLNNQTGGLRPNGLRESGEYAPLDELSYGTDNDKKELYRTGREYVLGIKKRLDIINMQSRSIKKKVI